MVTIVVMSWKTPDKLEIDWTLQLSSSGGSKIKSWCVESGLLLERPPFQVPPPPWSFAVWRALPSDNTGILGTAVLVNTQQTTPQTWHQPLLNKLNLTALF